MDIHAGRHGGLVLVPALHPFSAAGAIAAGGVIAGDHPPGRKQVFHDPAMLFHTQQPAAAGGTAGFAGSVPGHRDLHVRVDVLGHRSMRCLVAGLLPRRTFVFPGNIGFERGLEHLLLGLGLQALGKFRQLGGGFDGFGLFFFELFIYFKY